MAQLSCLLLSASAALAQADPAWVDPPRLEDPKPASKSGEMSAAALIGPAPSLEAQDTPTEYDKRLSPSSAHEARPERWPQRSYHYLPTTMRVNCGAQVPHCTVLSLFDFSASNPRRGRRSLGTGEHELVVSFAGSRPAITVENSRVLQRGARMRQ
jgi:hypothetical protein